MGKIEEALKALNKKLGEGSVFELNDNYKLDIPTISTGSYDLDEKLGGGIPRGRIIEILGDTGGGKTSLSLSVVKEAQKEGLKCAFIDMESAYNKEYSETIGVDQASLIFSQPNGGEDCVDIIEVLVKTGEVDLIICDSVASMIPMKEVDGEVSDNNIGLHARLMAKAMRRLTPLARQHNCTLIFINQTRTDIGVMYGDNQVGSGGRSLPYFCSQRIKIWASTPIKDKDLQIGALVKCKIIKNKIAVPFRTAEYNLIFGQGIDKFSDIIEFGVSKGIIEKSGSWYSYNNEKIGQGIEKVKEYFAADCDLVNELDLKIKEIINKPKN